MKTQAHIFGPLFLLFTVAFDVNLLVIGAVGLFLSFSLQIRGCVYAWILLGLFAIFEHTFLISDHAWQLGLEGSLALAFFITALSAEQTALAQISLESQLEIGRATQIHLEEERTRVEQAAQEQQMGLQERLANLCKELEDLQTEHSSILILNEVLRKTTAGHIQQNEQFAKENETLHVQLKEAKEESSQLASTDLIAMQNRELSEEIKKLTDAHEETKLLNDTLSRLYERETWKVKEASEEASSLSEQLSYARRQKEEPLIRQLRKQFEEKDQVLQQTRRELFKTDTELQRLQREQEALQLSPLPKEVEKELQHLFSQVERLEEENGQLQEIVTQLSGLEKPKKKVKTKSSLEQESLW